MTIDELLTQLLEVQAKLAKLDPASPAHIAGKIIEAALLHSLGVTR